MYLWIAFAVTALVIYLAWRGFGTDTAAGQQAPRPSRPSRPIAPDDDPDFLREIDKKLRGPDKNDTGGNTL